MLTMKTLAPRLALFVAIFVPLGCYVQAGSAVPLEGQVTVTDPPPPPVAFEEPVPPPPAVGVVWIGGYHRWEGRRYLWERGHYERPPRSNARYVRGHWEPRRHGKVWVNGYWHSG
jgi:hypothetical protein